MNCNFEEYCENCPFVQADQEVTVIYAGMVEHTHTRVYCENEDICKRIYDICNGDRDIEKG